MHRGVSKNAQKVKKKFFSKNTLDWGKRSVRLWNATGPPHGSLYQSQAELYNVIKRIYF